MQLGKQLVRREPGWKLNESGELFDMKDAPFVEKPADSADARKRLGAVLTQLNPAGGKTEDIAPGSRKGGKKGRKKKGKQD